MRQAILILSVVISFFIIVNLGCEFNAVRDNPLDPEGEYYTPPRTVSGKITRQDGSTAIADVNIILTPGYCAGYTDNSGNYTIQCPSPGEYTMTISHSEYKSIVDDIYLPMTSGLVLNYSMNAIPVIDSFTVTTQRLRYDIDDDLYDQRVHIFANIFDPDGSSQMDSSQVEVYYLDEVTGLTKVQDRIYEYLLSESSFPEGDIQNLFNIPFYVRVIDKDGDTTYSNPVELDMFLNFSLDPQEPCIEWGTGIINGTEIPSFIWEFPDFDTYFVHRYILSVIKTSNQTEVFNKTLYDTTANFFVDDTLYNIATFELIEDTLASGEYTWSVKLLNVSGDLTRSAIFSFEVLD